MYERPGTSGGARHPLKVARGALGLSQTAYARLVATTHEELGFGPMAVKNHHKVLRWESGGTAPEPTAQLAIAHIHQVPEDEVRRLGWPHWLHLATDDATLLHQRLTPGSAVEALRTTARLTDGRPRSYLAVTGSALSSQIRNVLTALDDPPPLTPRSGPCVTPEGLVHVEARIEALERQEVGAQITPAVLYFAARAEHRLITSLLTSGGYSRATGSRLLLLAARAARLCSWLCGCLGEEARAERFSLAAIRTAAAAGAPDYVASFLPDLAFRHLAGAPTDVLSLVAAARGVVRQPSFQLAAILHTREAQAFARLGEDKSADRALDRAAAALSVRYGSPNPFFAFVDETCLASASGAVWLLLGRPRRALSCLAPLLEEGSESHRPGAPSPYAARRFLSVVDTQLALGELDAAVHTAHRAIAVVGSLPPGMARQYRQLFTPHAAEPPVRDLLASLSEQLGQ
ncbi:hypothetical protein [Streptomyces melanogenes]|uniref:hypothetical protein n=1 Tax=Streptomyces melanogenes TaxID=67326 RepID=UPI00167C552F|nr:hypothetical protein [Streptomyces melanogenes]GGP85783.1 hypothetical protein GCM10010278_75270 [Streptomyces melanogenes]